MFINTFDEKKNKWFTFKNRANFAHPGSDKSA